MRRVLLSTALLGSLGLAAWPAAAQSLSADQIIRGLKPTAPTSTSRGIRQIGPSDSAPAAAAPSAPASPGAAAPRPSASAAPAQPSKPPAVNLTVNFASGSADLTPQAIRALDELGRALSSPALSAYHFRIEGHTDTVGAPDTNKVLSSRRADAVVAYLASKWNVERSRLDPIGMGQDQPMIPTGPNVPNAQNRRVTVVNTGA